MANKEHMHIIAQGAEAWNHWKHGHPDMTPELKHADLYGADLTGFDLTGSDLTRADLRTARLVTADLSDTVLTKADLRGADLSSANLRCANLRETILFRARMVEADLTSAILTAAILFNADLRRAKLIRADLCRAKLFEATLREANLGEAKIRNADLSYVDLHAAVLVRADLHGTDLTGANLSRSDISDADLRGVKFDGGDGESAADVSRAVLKSTRFTSKRSSESSASFLDLAAANGLDTADFGDPLFLPSYLAEAFEYAHQPHLDEKRRWPSLVERAIQNIKPLRKLFENLDQPPLELIQVVSVISAELIRYLSTHPKALYIMEPRQFEEMVAEILASYGWEVILTPATKDGGYDLFAVSKDIAGVETSWIIECKKYSPSNKVGVDIVRALYGVKYDLKVANAMLATTSWFTEGVRAFKASRYDLELRDYQGIVEWLNQYRPHPDGRLYIKHNHLVLPGHK
ncbi:hypothetical protein ES703_39417 [subsurface metagenome]